MIRALAIASAVVATIVVGCEGIVYLINRYA